MKTVQYFSGLILDRDHLAEVGLWEEYKKLWDTYCSGSKHHKEFVGRYNTDVQMISVIEGHFRQDLEKFAKK